MVIVIHDKEYGIDSDLLKWNGLEMIIKNLI